VILSIPLVATFGDLNVWLIYAVTFIQSTIFIAFSAGEFAAIPSLVSKEDLVTANGRIQASYSGAQVAGPLLAGALLSVLPLTWVLTFDAGSFAISALSLSLVRRSFNVAGDETKERKSILHDVREGLRYVLSHPVLRNISVMMALINFVGASTYAQLVLFATERLDASKREIGLLFAAGQRGRRRNGLARRPSAQAIQFHRARDDVVDAHGRPARSSSPGMRWYWARCRSGTAAGGLGILFNINTGSLRQAIVPTTCWLAGDVDRRRARVVGDSGRCAPWRLGDQRDRETSRSSTA
jgi:hypothetical protein